MGKRILILSDSLALPRENPEVCHYEETWPILLKKAGHEIHQVSIGGTTSYELLRQCHYHKSFNPDVVIVQAGIVDCAPRFIGRKEKSILKKIPFFGHKILNKLNNPSFRRMRSITYTKKEEFSKNIKEIALSFSGNAKLFLVEIVGGEGYDRILPNAGKNISDYNTILQNIEGTNYIKYYQPGITMSDFHHLNKNGHKVLFENIMLKFK